MHENKAHYFPEEYQQWLFEALQLEPGHETEPELIEHLYRLNRQWVHSDEVMDYDSEHDLMRAYALYYMTINMPKLWFVLDHLSRSLRPVTEVTEFGCGSGTFLWAYLFYLRETDPESLKLIKTIRGIDRSPAALKIAESMAAVLQKQPEFAHITMEFIAGDWKEHTASTDGMAIFGNVMNEGMPEGVDLAKLNADQAVIIEPGTRKVFQPLLTCRKTLLDAGYNILFPCPTSESACPMENNPENWCHFAINRFALPFIQRISNKAGRLNPRHNFTGFVFDRASSETDSHDWRCVSTLKKVKRSGIRWLCNGCELKETILNRHARSPENKPFLKAEWGDCLHIEPKLSGVHLKADHTVTLFTED